jgi:hypothetical protein
MLQAAAVPAFLIRQLLANAGEPAISGLRGVLRLFRRGN